MAYHKSQMDWMKENTILVSIRVNKNQNPELFNACDSAESKSGLARELILDGLKYRRQALDLLPEK